MGPINLQAALTGKCIVRNGKTELRTIRSRCLGECVNFKTGKVLGRVVYSQTDINYETVNTEDMTIDVPPHKYTEVT